LYAEVVDLAFALMSLCLAFLYADVDGCHRAVIPVGPRPVPLDLNFRDFTLALPLLPLLSNISE
jgi:hypothetical protein